MSAAVIIQGITAALFVAMLVAYLFVRGGTWSGSSTMKQLLVWYPLSSPWLLVRAPILYLLVEYLGVDLWVAIVLEFIVERPLFFLTAREIAHRVK